MEAAIEVREEPSRAHYSAVWVVGQETVPTVYEEGQENPASEFCWGLHRRQSFAPPNCRRWVSEANWPYSQQSVRPFVQVVEDLTVQPHACVESAAVAAAIVVVGVAGVVAAANGVDAIDAAPLDAADVAVAAAVVVGDDGQFQNAAPGSYKVST